MLFIYLGQLLSVWSLHVLPMLYGVFSGYSGFLPQPENMHGVIIDSKLAVGVNVSVDDCPAMDW